MMKIRYALAAAAVASLPTGAWAECNINGSGEVNVISNFFETLELLANTMKECNSDSVTVDYKLTTEHRPETEQAFAAESSPFDAAAVANSSITLLQARGQLMPLNDLVEKHRDQYNIEDQMLIRFGEDIMAIAFMVNAQHFFLSHGCLRGARACGSDDLRTSCWTLPPSSRQLATSIPMVRHSATAGNSPTSM